MSTFDDLGDLRLVGFEFERRQKAQRAQVKGHDWRNTLLRMNTGRTGCDGRSDGVSHR